MSTERKTTEERRERTLVVCNPDRMISQTDRDTQKKKILDDECFRSYLQICIRSAVIFAIFRYRYPMHRNDRLVMVHIVKKRFKIKRW